MKLADKALLHNQCYLNGHWVSGTGQTLSVKNPATGAVLGSVPALEPTVVQDTIANAVTAFEKWKAFTAEKRGDFLYQWYRLMLDNREDLAQIMTAEQGKPLAESRGEIDYAASYVKWFAEEARRAYGDTIPAASKGQHIIVIPQPVGVCAAVTPWNFPAAMITRKAAAALAAGCTMVVKPSGLTPFSALALAHLVHEAGIPAGVFNVVTGDSAAIAEAFCTSRHIKKLSFTGSTAVGRKLMAQCAPNLQKLSLELGGNAPFLVFDDADVDRAVKGALAAKFRNTGQTCICPNRFLVQAGIHDTFVAALGKAVAALKVGDGTDEEVKQCSLINNKALEKVQRHYDDALAKGACVTQGERPGVLPHNRVAPVILTGVKPDMQLWHEETFGPLAAVAQFDTEQEGLDLANDTPYGLAAYFFTGDADRIWRVGEALKAGMVGINEGAISNAAAPFGGVDQSGFGREGSRYGMSEYQQLKYLCFAEASEG
ncbi:MAG TPA: NAD-dependent succinate-semialdehyde dehydrogenase [Cellvibrionaceae bacterium]